jgi:hypothetical protein
MTKNVKESDFSTLIPFGIAFNPLLPWPRKRKERIEDQKRRKREGGRGGEDYNKQQQPTNLYNGNKDRAAASDCWVCR